MFTEAFDTKAKDIKVLYTNAVDARKSFEKKFEELLLEGLEEVGLSGDVYAKENRRKGRLVIAATNIDDKPYRLSFHRYAATSGNLCANEEYIRGMDIYCYKDIKEYLSKMLTIFEAANDADI